MGASGWTYFVPYQPDIRKAFADLRQQVFESGEYYRFPHIRQPKPATIEELFEQNQEAGTHTIIDIMDIADSPDVEGFLLAIPLSESQLLEFFGTKKPTRAMIEQKEDTLMDLRERWMATYVIVYQDDQPTEIYFTGFSGD